MAADPNIYANFLRPAKSVQDYADQLDEAQQRQQALQIGANQIANLPLQRQMLQLQLSGAQISNQTLQQRLDLARAIIAGDAPSEGQAAPMALAQGATDGSVGPTVANAGRMNALTAAAGAMPGGSPATPVPGLPGLTFGRVTGMKLLGGPDMGADFKMGLEGVSHAPGSEVTDVKGNRRTVPTLGQGQYIDGTGTVQNLPGYVGSTSAAAGATTNAQEQAKNRNTPAPLDRVNPDTGRPYSMTMDDLINSLRPAAPAAPATVIDPSAGGQAAGQPAISQLPAGAATRTLPNGQQVMTGTQSAAMLDMAARGQDMSTMKVNGQPAFATPQLQDLQTQLDGAKQAGPEGLARFQATMLPKLLAIPDPAQRQRALAGFNADLQTPPGTPLHSLGATPDAGAAPTPMAAAPAPAMAPAAPAFSGFAGPSELAASKVSAENAANLATKPALTSADTLARNVQDADAAYSKGLDTRAQEGLALKTRNAELAKNMETFQTGLAGGHLRLDVASNLANMFPGSPAIQAAAQKIAGGDIAAGQTFRNLIAGAMVTNALQVLDGQGRLTKAITSQLQQAAEDSATDPRAMTRIMSIQNRLADQDLAEQKARADSIKAGTYDPRTWQADYNQMRLNAAADPNSVYSPASPGATPTPGGFKYIGPAADQPKFAAGGVVDDLGTFNTGGDSGGGQPGFSSVYGGPQTLQNVASGVAGGGVAAPQPMSTPAQPGQMQRVSGPLPPSGTPLPGGQAQYDATWNFATGAPTNIGNNQPYAQLPPTPAPIGSGGTMSTQMPGAGAAFEGAAPVAPQATVGGNSLNNVVNGRVGSVQAAAVPTMSWQQQPISNAQQFYADGGRVEPVIGSRSPLPQGGTGGGLSTNAIVQAMVGRAAGPSPQGAALPTNYLVNPRAVLAGQEARADGTQGGAVSGPGGPTGDAIPAWLSDKEHVVTADEITALGDGDNALGQRRMQAFRAQLAGAR